ncbi:hypothetical protein SRB5_16360 [Streptomyces sp. RB5]|uniref:Transposase n=1 Tax=Streptomyces smaragdinus TaxID=2585196 RepID=A0A7K0CDI1_9ACTN|nr:hypothetical protein [Streptomyces smaragdinus]MQY11517.1 hypothetical protein [Streptomyces smaragdinus]
MVSSSHEAMHQLFREDPGVFARTFRRLGLDFDDPSSVTVLPTDLTELKPLERRVDTLLRFDNPDGSSYLLAVEAQGKPDAAKPSSWAYYLAHLYAKYDVPPVLLVVCNDIRTARWAETPFIIGPRQLKALTLRTLVLGPHNVPVVTDAAEATADIPLATLSAIVHARSVKVDAILQALASALHKQPDEDALPYIEFIESGLGSVPAAVEIWRKLMAMDISMYQGETAQRLRAEGRVEDRIAVILEALDERGIELTDEDRRRVTTCTDYDTLLVWSRRTYTASSAAEVFTDE